MLLLPLLSTGQRPDTLRKWYGTGEASEHTTWRSLQTACTPTTHKPLSCSLLLSLSLSLSLCILCAPPARDRHPPQPPPTTHAQPTNDRFLAHVHAISIAPPWVAALLTAMRVPTKNAIQVKKVIQASGGVVACIRFGSFGKCVYTYDYRNRDYPFEVQPVFNFGHRPS